ncbi:hypothetical protein CEUSTIGMA_g12031.t1 [Chlamydomonas eustigma]|uniref:Armadillo repeat-containing domain-containing protein n=1 Tax=Chlamydomonas eustigma TaxID=1157962 RepID=A0A250XP83_9CHLO|nr:hypothetical protein CEUSTIGMA_g12031.t1 [Chlamydomonas eustigma]|eukprot:GAX84610.1 hypothetical protein CEUSTIGMA_g12031.t1 [Chlamydomonas eustigma]
MSISYKIKNNLLGYVAKASKADGKGAVAKGAEPHAVAIKQEIERLRALLGEAYGWDKITTISYLRFIVQELRPVPRPGSAYAALSLMLKAANTPAGAEQLISGGVLSACSQIYYLSGMEPVWRRACLDILADITETRRYRKGFSSEEEEDEEEEEKETVEVKSPLDLVDIPADSSIVVLEDMRDPCPEGALFITGIMMKLLSKYIQPGLHLSALQAMRDVAHSPLAAQAIVTEGALQAAVNLIGRNLTKDGLYPPDWAAQVHRESVLLVAMLALRTEVKDEIVQAGAIEALCTCMTNHLKYDKDMGSVRMTAAAALVPILGSDDGLIYRAVKAGALNALLPMLNSPSVKEQEVSGKILEVLTKDPDLINKLDLARTAEQAFRARQAALEERGQV